MDEKILTYLKGKSPYLYAKRVNIKNIGIEERVKLKCFHCKNHNKKWTCPPRINMFDFEKVYKEYDNAMIIYCEIPFKGEYEYQRARNDSTNLVHKSLLDIEKILYENNESLALSFIGGSCKLCKECDVNSCRFPALSRIPLEATGVNVVKFVKKELGMDITFPLEKYMYRFGLILW